MMSWARVGVLRMRTLVSNISTTSPLPTQPSPRDTTFLLAKRATS